MAEGASVDWVTGPDGEARDTDGSAVGPDAVAVAVALDIAAEHPTVAADASAFLQSQKRLVDLQVEHFDEERCFATAAAKRKRYSDRIRNGLATFLAGVAGAAVISLTVMIWNAYRDHGLVIEAFSVPPDFAAQGISGRVVASELLDDIDQMQSYSLTARRPSSFQNAWGDDLKVEIPEVGVSVGELSRFLHRRLGHTMRIDGEVIRTADQVSVVARIDGQNAARVVGTEAGMDAKGWGDVLMKHGNIAKALAKYDEALEYAPNWKQLKEAREAAAKQKS